MNIKKIILIITILFIPNISVKAYELCTPTKEYKKYQKLSQEEKKKYQEPIFCSEIASNKKQYSFLKSSLYSKLYSSASDTSYNSYTAGVATSPKNQDATGLCWDFSAISTVEANANKKGVGTFDLSESHLAYSILSGTYTNPTSIKDKYNTDTNGGKITYAPSYFYGGYGQLTEEELPFLSRLILDTNYNDGTKTLSKITPSTYVSGRNILTVNDFTLETYHTPETCSNTDISTIKTSIIKNGAVQATMYMDQELFLDNKEEYYIAKTSNSDSSNHGVTIIGWDDNISKTKFNGATRNGAWIIKNSWGTEWSSDGFFYISYDDDFICGTTASYDLSTTTKTYNHVYKSSPVVGVPLLSFNDTFYIATKFNKQSTNNEVKEALERISISVGEYMNYTVYLSKDNNKSNSSNWIEIASGSSSLYGIKSIDISNQEITNDYTIIIKYEVSSNMDSSIFMTCDYMDDTDNIEYTSGVNFISSNGTSWADMSNMSVSSTPLKCQPNTYVYTNELSELEITNTTKKNTGVDVDLKIINIDTNNIMYKIENSNNEDVTSHFTITPDYNNKKVYIISDNSLLGTFTLKITYGTIETTTTFTLTSSYSLEDNTQSKIDTENSNYYVVVHKGEKLTYGKLLENIKSVNTEIIIKNTYNQVIEDTNALVGTGYTISINGNVYNIVLQGDVTGDGKINSGDLMMVINYLRSSITLTDSQSKASDCNNNGKINSGDLMLIINFLRGAADITIKE